MNEVKDMWGKDKTEALEMLKRESHSVPHKFELVRGVWVATFMSSPDAYEQARGAWKATPSYCAVGKESLWSGIGTKKMTVDSAIKGELVF